MTPYRVAMPPSRPFDEIATRTSTDRVSSLRVGAVRWRTVLIVVTTIACARGMPSTELADPPARPRVIVSGSEARIVFPRDTARWWGWTDQVSGGALPYAWNVRIEALDGTRLMRYQIRRVQSTGGRRSLASLLAGGRGSICRVEFGEICGPGQVTARLDDARVVLFTLDSAMIVRLFGTKPRSVRVWAEGPGFAPSFPLDSVRVEYVAPAVGAPDSATRVNAAQVIRRFHESVTSVDRFVRGGIFDQGPIWLGIGDTLPIAARETRCRIDACLSPLPVRADSGWSVADSSIARVYAADGGSMGFDDREPAQAYLIGARLGRTRVRVSGLTGPVDSLRDGTRVSRAVEREVVVGPPVHEIIYVPRPDSAVVGEPIQVRMWGIGSWGSADWAPVALTVLRRDGAVRIEGRPLRDGGQPPAFSFDTPGRFTVIAHVGTHAESLAVTVLARRSSRPTREYAPSRTHVIVSANEARIIFPRQTRPPSRWGWSTPPTRPHADGYYWEVRLRGSTRPHALRVRVSPDSARGYTFPSLAALVATATPALCIAEVVEDCTSEGITLRVEDERLVIVIHDRALVEELFRLRPWPIDVWHDTPEATSGFPDTVQTRVIYVDPQLPLPDGQFLASAERERRAYVARTTHVNRVIAGGGDSDDAIRLQEGDTLDVQAREGVWREYGSAGPGDSLEVERWIMGNTEVARVIAPSGSAEAPGGIVRTSRARIIAEGTGRTFVHIVGLRGPGDTVTTIHRIPHEARRTIIVMPRVARMAIHPRPETLRVGEKFPFEVQAFDRRGERITEARASLEILGPSAGRRLSTFGPQREVEFGSPGSYTLIATLGRMADTLRVEVLP